MEYTYLHHMQRVNIRSIYGTLDNDDTSEQMDEYIQRWIDRKILVYNYEAIEVVDGGYHHSKTNNKILTNVEYDSDSEDYSQILQTRFVKTDNTQHQPINCRIHKFKTKKQPTVEHRLIITSEKFILDNKIWTPLDYTFAAKKNLDFFNLIRKAVSISEIFASILYWIEPEDLADDSSSDESSTYSFSDGDDEPQPFKYD